MTGKDEYDIYLAGPFFNMPQAWLVDEARLAFQGMGLKVFSPYHDIGIGPGAHVAPKDIDALEKSRAVSAILDGVDTGTVFEAGFARARNKPVVAFAQCTPEEPLKMISGTGCEVVSDFVSAIYRAAGRLGGEAAAATLWRDGFNRIGLGATSRPVRDDRLRTTTR